MVFKNKTLPFHMLNMYCNKILHNKPVVYAFALF